MIRMTLGEWIVIGYLVIGLFVTSIFNGFLKGDLSIGIYVICIFTWPVWLGALMIAGIATVIILVGHKIGEWIADLF